jgi:hypothetical protein
VARQSIYYISRRIRSRPSARCFNSYTSNCQTINMDLSESQTTFPSDSEVYDANYDANHSNSQDSEEQTSYSTARPHS